MTDMKKTNAPQNRNEQATSTPPTIAFWGWWVLASGLGGATVGWLEAWRFQFAATLLFAGFIVGLAQWLVLRRQLRWSWLWPLVTGFGLILGNLLSLFLPPSTILATWLWQQLGLWEVLWLNVVNSTIAMTVMGGVQLALLRRYPRSWRWVPISALAGLLMGATGASVCYVACDAIASAAGSPLSTAVTYGSGWVMQGIVTGWLLIQFLFRNSEFQKSEV